MKTALQLNNLLKEEKYNRFIQHIGKNERNHLVMSYDEYKEIIFSLMNEDISSFKENYKNILAIYLKQLKLFELQNVIESDLQMLKKKKFEMN